jgi:hypothetical protein
MYTFVLFQAQENLGMVMIFQLVSAAHEWLELRCDEKQLEQEANEAQRKKDEEEAELVSLFLCVFLCPLFLFNSFTQFASHIARVFF